MKAAPPSKRVHNRSRRKLRTILLFGSLPLFFLSFILVVVGIVLNREPDFISPLPLGKYITQRSNDSAQIQKFLRKAHIQYQGVYMTNDYSYVVKLKDGEMIFFSPKKPIDQQISSLQLVLSRLTIEGKRFSSLDFRFDNPVIIYQK